MQNPEVKSALLDIHSKSSSSFFFLRTCIFQDRRNKWQVYFITALKSHLILSLSICITRGFDLIDGLPHNKNGKTFIKLDLQTLDTHSSCVSAKKKSHSCASQDENESRNSST